MRSRLFITLFLIFSNISFAQQSAPYWQLNFDLAFIDPSGDAVAVGVGPSGVDVDFDSKVGAGFRAGYRFTESWEFELGILGTSSVDVMVGDIAENLGVATGVSSFSPVTAGINYYFASDSHLNVFAGVFLAAVNYGDVDVEVGLTGVATGESVDTDFTWGVISGLEVPIGAGGWLLQTNIRYIDTSIAAASDGDRFKGDFDPVIFSIGVGYRF